MIKQVFIINGSGGVGKDEFINMIPSYGYELFGEGENCRMYLRTLEVGNYSSVSKVKEIARAIGWDGEKTEKDRKFLSDLKLLTTTYNDMSLNDMKIFTNNFMLNDNINKILFLHIREPEEIEKAINAFKKYNAKSILVKRDSVKHITSNPADGNVYEYDYDIIINNNGTLVDLKNKAECFYKDLLNDSFKKEY